MNDTNITERKGCITERVAALTMAEMKSQVEEEHFRKEYGPMKSRAAANPVTKRATEKRKAQRKRAKAARRANR